VRRADPHRALLRSLTARYPCLLILASRTEPWASMTFVGARHILTCAAGPDLTGIGDEEFALPGHIVADIGVELEADRVVIEALTIETA
jgi:hypothetical protein